jgi:hypothetical protein
MSSSQHVEPGVGIDLKNNLAVAFYSIPWMHKLNSV